MSTPKLKQLYESTISLRLEEKLNISNPHLIPKLQKIVLSMGVGKAIAEKKRIESAVFDMKKIAGQAPVVIKAKKSISNFKLRQGMEIGVVVTLRGNRMYEFLDRLISITIPRIRDFRGLSRNSFDGNGNYNFGLPEQSVFAEIDAENIQYTQGININIGTTASNDVAASQLLQLFGMPFREK